MDRLQNALTQNFFQLCNIKYELSNCNDNRLNIKYRIYSRKM